MLILFFDIEEEDLDKNKIVENDDEDENHFSDNESFNKEIMISSDEEVNDNNLNNLIHTFKSNIDEMIKSYVKLNYNQNFTHINLKYNFIHRQYLLIIIIRFLNYYMIKN